MLAAKRKRKFKTLKSTGKNMKSEIVSRRCATISRDCMFITLLTILPIHEKLNRNH